jgi:hypothetical protein
MTRCWTSRGRRSRYRAADRATWTSNLTDPAGGAGPRG